MPALPSYIHTYCHYHALLHHLLPSVLAIQPSFYTSHTFLPIHYLPHPFLPWLPHMPTYIHTYHTYATHVPPTACRRVWHLDMTTHLVVRGGRSALPAAPPTYMLAVPLPVPWLTRRCSRLPTAATHCCCRAQHAAVTPAFAAPACCCLATWFTACLPLPRNAAAFFMPACCSARPYTCLAPCLPARTHCLVCLVTPSGTYSSWPSCLVYTVLPGCTTPSYTPYTHAYTHTRHLLPHTWVHILPLPLHGSLHIFLLQFCPCHWFTYCLTCTPFARTHTHMPPRHTPHLPHVLYRPLPSPHCAPSSCLLPSSFL